MPKTQSPIARTTRPAPTPHTHHHSLTNTTTFALLILLTTAINTPAQGATQIITMNGNAPPDGNGTFSSLSNPILNNNGQTAFRATLTGTTGGSDDDNAIYRSDGTALTKIDREFLIPGPLADIILTNLSAPHAINDAGQVLYSVTQDSSLFPSNRVIRLGTGATNTTIVAENNDAPDGNGEFSSTFSTPSLSPSGQAAFFAVLDDTAGGTTDNLGIFISGDAGPITQVAREGQPAPDANGSLSILGVPLINASGQAAFSSSLTGTAGGADDNKGIFIGNGGPVTQVARTGQPTPDATGSYISLGNPALNDSGQTAFLASMTATSDGDRGIFIGSGGPITQVARTGQPAPDGNGSYSAFGSPALNNAGQAAFVASLNDTPAGPDDDEGVLIP